MMAIMLIAGILLTVLSGLVLSKILRVLVSTRRELRRHGIVSRLGMVAPGAVLVVGGLWTLGLVAGLALIIISQQ